MTPEQVIKFQDKAAEKLTLTASDNEHSCQICARIYKSKKACMKHILNIHIREIEDLTMDILNAHLIEKLHWTKEYFDRRIGTANKNFNEMKDEVSEALNKYGYDYVSRHMMPECVSKEFQLRWINMIAKKWNAATDIEGYILFAGYLKDIRYQFTDYVIMMAKNSKPDNETMAKAQFIGDFGFLKEAELTVAEILKIQKEIDES
jgi:hypothetical protein